MSISRPLHLVTRGIQLLLALYAIRLVIKISGYNVYIPVLDDLFLMIWRAFLYLAGLLQGLIRFPNLG